VGSFGSYDSVAISYPGRSALWGFAVARLCFRCRRRRASRIAANIIPSITTAATPAPIPASAPVLSPLVCFRVAVGIGVDIMVELVPEVVFDEDVELDDNVPVLAATSSQFTT
jgi:hypothetical protein